MWATSPAPLWFCFSRMSIIFLLFLVSWLHASLALFLSSGMHLIFAPGPNTLHSAEDDDMPVMCWQKLSQFH